jgi:hypothetical protein
VTFFSPEDVFTVLVSTVKLSFGKTRGSYDCPSAVTYEKQYAIAIATVIFAFLNRD